MRHTGLNGARRHFAAIAVEQRQLAARLGQPPLQISPLRLGRPQRCRNILVFFAQGQGSCGVSDSLLGTVAKDVFPKDALEGLFQTQKRVESLRQEGRRPIMADLCPLCAR